MATYYYNGIVGNSVWSTLGNWSLDYNNTVPVLQLPSMLDDVVINGFLSDLAGQTRIIKNLEQIGGGFEIYTHAISATESMHFYAGYNDNINLNVAFRAPVINFYNGYETLAGLEANVVNFYDNSICASSIHGIVNFYDNSRCYNFGNLYDMVNFYENSFTDANIIFLGDVSIHDNAVLHETITIQGDLFVHSPATVNPNWTVLGDIIYVQDAPAPIIMQNARATGVRIRN